MKLNRKSWPKLVRGLLSLSVLLGICAMVLPLPIAALPQNAQEKDSSEPFPCQNRPCGCRSAEQCWKKCCCFDNSQKIAWAKANNVKVPNYVLVAAKKENESLADSRRAGDVNPLITPATLAKLGYSRPPLGVCYLRPAAKKAAGCCEHCAKKLVVAKTSSKTSSPSKTSKAAKSKWVLAVYAAECQGQGPPAFCFPTSIIPERVALLTPSVKVIESVVVESERLQQTSLRPPLPPPKIV